MLDQCLLQAVGGLPRCLLLHGPPSLAPLLLQSPVHPAADVGVAAGVAALWCLQEWVVHAWLLHSPFDWAGRRIHEGHHARPYFHVRSPGGGACWGMPLQRARRGPPVAHGWERARSGSGCATGCLVRRSALPLYHLAALP